MEIPVGLLPPKAQKFFALQREYLAAVPNPSALYVDRKQRALIESSLKGLKSQDGFDYPASLDGYTFRGFPLKEAK